MKKRFCSFLLLAAAFMALASCRTPLVTAVLEDQTETVKTLIDKGADVNEKDQDGFTPLHWAAYYGKTEMVKVLLSKGAEVNARSTTYGTPLIVAAQYGFTDAVKALLERGADVNITDASGRTALNYAEDEMNKPIMELLKGSDAVNRRRTPLPVESEEAPPPLPPQDPGKVKDAEKPTKTTISRVASRSNISVFHFTPLSIDAADYSNTATNTLINALKAQESLVMLDRKDLETFLAINDLQQNDQIDNVVHIGTRLGLNFVIAGSVEKRGLTIITNCKVISIEQRKVVFTDRSKSLGEANLISNLLKTSDAIIENILGGGS